MQRLVCTTAIAVVFAVLSGVPLLSQATDPVIGTWELNVTKSKFSPGPGPKSETRTYVAAGQEIKATSKGIDGAGKPTNASWTIVYDGKDRPLIGNPDADMLSLKRVDNFTTEFTQKKAGKVVSTGTRVVSKDGKVLTITTKGTNVRGQAINDLEVYDKK